MCALTNERISRQNMAENLKSKEDESERKDKLEQVDSKLKYLKNLIIEEALRYANMDDEADLQKVALPTSSMTKVSFLEQKS